MSTGMRCSQSIMGVPRISLLKLVYVYMLYNSKIRIRLNIKRNSSLPLLTGLVHKGTICCKCYIWQVAIATLPQVGQQYTDMDDKKDAEREE